MLLWWGAGITMTGKGGYAVSPRARGQTTHAQFVFTTDQRCRLARHNVIEAQIAALEKVLPVVHAWISNPAPLQNVRDELKGLSKSLDSAQTSMERVLKPVPGIKAMLEAQSRLEQAHYLRELENYESILNTIADAVKVLEPIRQATTAAIDALPRVQRRSNRASPKAIEFIDSALISSWAQVNIPVHHGEYDPNSVQPLGGHTPPYPHVPSSGDGSPFREICRICYEVITGDKNADPERAIKAFVNQSKARDKKQRKELGIVCNPLPGTAASKKTRLPSVTGESRT